MTDSMRFFSALGKKYLQVDRVCLVQDGEQDKYQQLRILTTIYANAYFAFLALQGQGASHGLRGTGNGYQPRNVRRSALDYPKSGQFQQYRPSNPLNDSTLATRGWKFQELLFARIYLVVGVGWKCSCGSFREEIQTQEGAKQTTYYGRRLSGSEQ
jgi:hypothetical protein